MAGTWEERYVDRQVNRAWFELRLKVADRIADGLAAGEMEPLSIAVGDELLMVTVSGGVVSVFDGDCDAFVTHNADEAAYEVFEVLHEEWQVIHPAFLESDLIDGFRQAQPPERRAPVAEPAPALGRAETKEELQAWVEATFQAELEEPLKVDPHNDIRWNTPSGEPVVVSVRADDAIEIWAILGREVGLKKSRRMIDRLAHQYNGLKFFLSQDRLLMSYTLTAKPYVGEQLDRALGEFTAVFNGLDWVANAVLRKRAVVARDELTAALDAAHAAEERARRAERSAERRKQQREWASKNVRRLRAERDAARAEIERLKRLGEHESGGAA